MTNLVITGPPRMRSPLRIELAARALLVAITAAFIVTVMTGSGASTGSGRLGGDYPAFYAAGRIVNAGHGRDLYDGKRQETTQHDLYPAGDTGYLPFAYPPVVAAIYAPLARLDYRLSYVVATLLMAGAFVVALHLMRPMIRAIDENFSVSVALALTFYPAFRGITGGQNTALTLLLLAASWRAVHDSHDLAAGFALGLLLFKPQLAMVFLLLHMLARRWRVLVGAAVGAALLWSASAAVMGPGWLMVWWRYASRFSETDAVVNGHNSISWLGAARVILGGNSPLAKIVGFGLVGATVALTVWVWRGAPRTDLAAPMAVAASAALLCSPHTVFYDAGLLALTGAVLADRMITNGRRILVAIWVASIAHALTTSIGLTPVFAVAALTFVVALLESGRPAPAYRLRPVVDQTGGPELSIVIPAYNEANRIGPTLESIASALTEWDTTAEVIVVDDGSADATATVAEQHRASLATAGASLRVIVLDRNGGKGGAVRRGMLAATGRRRLFMDADNATDLRELSRLEAAHPDARIRIASIAAPGADVVHRQPGLRGSRSQHCPVGGRFAGPRMTGEKHHAVRVVAMRQRHTQRGNCGQAGGDAVDHRHCNARRLQVLDLFAPTAKDKRVTALQAHHVFAFADSHQHQLFDEGLRCRFATAALADIDNARIWLREGDDLVADQIINKQHRGVLNRFERFERK